MSLSKQQIEALLGLISSTSDDALGCECCFERLAEFADAELTGRNLCEAMKAVRRHIESCPCCADEFQALLVALKGVSESDC